MLPEMLDLASLRALYAGGTSPLDVADALGARMAASNDPAIFITAVDREGLRSQAEALLRRAPTPNSLPLWGVPYAVKDNIDVAGMPTTAACPAFAYAPAHDAFAVAQLRAAGALVIGKTNLDQFATGLNGTRSPYGAPRCVFDSTHISGGSSSGSGGRRCRGPRGLCARHRYGGVGSGAGGAEQHRRHKADARADQLDGDGAGLPEPRHDLDLRRLRRRRGRHPQDCRRLRCGGRVLAPRRTRRVAGATADRRAPPGGSRVLRRCRDGSAL